MPVLELTDNLQPKDKYQPAKLKAVLATLGEQDLKDLQFIESCTLSDLQKESKVLLHSCDIEDPEDREAFVFECGHHDDSRIFSLHGSSGNYRMQSYNLVGFIGRNDVCITIRDYGKGIPQEILHSLFDGAGMNVNRQGDSHKGMGIGLTLCKTIVAAHGGTISASNHPNGAQFTFTLPNWREY